MGACSTLAPANSHVDSCTSPISFGLCLTQNLQHVPAFSRMRSKGFPFIVWGSGGWTLVRLKWLVASSSGRRCVVVGGRRRVVVASLIPCLWEKLQNISFSKVSKQVVISFCVARVALYTLHSTTLYTLHTPHSTLHHTLHFAHSSLHTLN